MIEWNVQHLLGVLGRCGEIALTHYEQPVVSIKDDQSLVTRADFEIENYLSSLFDEPEEGSYMIGEETVHRKSASYVSDAFGHIAWVIDPIDGTAPYAHHIPTWGISIARMVNGRLADGAIYLPSTGEIFVTERAHVLFGRKGSTTTDLSSVKLDPLRAPASEDDDETLLHRGMIAVAQDVARGSGIRVPNPVQALGCAVLPLTYLLLGRYLAYIGTVKLWDMAAALPMLLRLGLPVQLASGAQLNEEVSDTFYRLDRGDPRQWKLRDKLVCGLSAGAISHMMNALSRASSSSTAS